MVFPNICWYHQISSSWHWMVCMVSSVNCGARIGTGEVIKGWDEGLLRMSQGEKATLGVRSDYAYGALPCRCLGYLGIWGADTWNLGEARDVGWFFGTKQGKSSFFSGCWFHPLEFAARRIEESRLVVHREWRSILIQYFYVCMSVLWFLSFFWFIFHWFYWDDPGMLTEERLVLGASHRTPTCALEHLNISRGCLSRPKMDTDGTWHINKYII